MGLKISHFAPQQISIWIPIFFYSWFLIYRGSLSWEKKELRIKVAAKVYFTDFFIVMTPTIDFMFVYNSPLIDLIELKIGMLMFSRSPNTSVMLICSTEVTKYSVVVLQPLTKKTPHWINFRRILWILPHCTNQIIKYFRSSGREKFAFNNSAKNFRVGKIIIFDLPGFERTTYAWHNNVDTAMLRHTSCVRILGGQKL
jgi:hypothetical protein